MRVSTKFPVAVHTMIIIAALSDMRKINSDIIAESTGVNAVTIRNIFTALKQADMILVSPGPGGARLARSPDSITLWDIFIAVEPMNTEDLFPIHQNPSDHCPVGGNIYGLLKTHLDDAVDALKNKLSGTTIAMMVDELRDLLPELPPLPERRDSP
ncbi:Rrf2 family transcriptional regulator [Brucepastera parasyntrophica]|uniref:Rrf2 family transcriptional regulator n=1 Tax=Brucepastera parasyntrophica TaxID=2880008 RepID=UPI002108F968|nr:Rrf2 family transcriptional regulator [Brucepastera parasyntrophica]ULQ58513.1 Rrf2 family transcriptional regulator [Brucepastera parasyntrophica]